MKIKFMLLTLLTLSTTACWSTSSPDITGSPYEQANAIKAQGGAYKVGNPYKILGQYYTPKEDYNYSETGIASWYGDDFHAKKTANGEDYNMNSLTAAHRTLPMPSVVKVTNLENGRSLVLRINDRGPFAKNRIIDVSKRGAQLLGFQTQGTAKVRVEILAKESKELKAALTGITDNTTYASTSTTTKYGEDINRRYLTGAGYTDYQSTYVAKSGKIYVQAGSFTNEKSASDLSTRLNSLGNPTITPTYVGGSNFYRVRFGPYASEAQAQTQLNKILDFGVYNAKIVHD